MGDRGSHLGPGRRPLILVGFSILFGAVALLAETQEAWYPNDASVHESMVRWAANRIVGGHLPFDGWYPSLALGASRFHHYQSLPHIITGLLSVPLGQATFRMSLYLLLATWPISVYVGARLLGLGRWPAAAAAALSPLLVSAPGLGFEWGSYLWRGSGTWAQLWGMWALPLAWGLSWRAVATGRRLWLGALAVGVLVCLHLLTGYLALLTIVVWILVRPAQVVRRSGRALLVGLGALAVAAWMLVPLVVDAPWTVNDEFSRGAIYYDSFGARRILGWLVTGGLFDHERFPIVTVLVGIGLVVAVTEARRREAPRAVLAAGILSMIVFFGRPTLGAVIDLLPGAGDLFLRRFVSGVHLAGLYLGGLGLTWLVAATRLGLTKIAAFRVDARAVTASWVIAAVLLAPAFIDRAHFAWRGATWIGEQRAADRTEGSAFIELVQEARRQGPGRVFAGHRSSGRTGDRIGFVPLYIAPLNAGADSVGFTRPTWSLMSPAEYRFDIDDPGMRRLFGVRYAILDGSSSAPDGAVEAGRSGRFVLYRFDEVSYVSVVDTVAPISANRFNLGAQTSWVMRSALPELGILPTLSFGNRAAATPTLGQELPREPGGRVLDVRATPASGVFTADVELERRAVVLLAASFDPRWGVSVDGVETPSEMIVPALVGATVPAGTHRVVFLYHPFPWYGPLFLLAGLGLVVLLVVERLGRRSW